MPDENDGYVTRTGMVVDPVRISTFDNFLFRPFRVERTEPLALGLERRQIAPGRDVLVAETAGGTIVLDKPQMAYFHTAQGELKGQPWLVCF